MSGHAPLSPEEVAALRPAFPVTQRKGVFLNHAATSPVSSGTVAAMEAAARRMAAPLDEHFFEDLGTVEQTRRILAELMGGHPSELAFCLNTSTAISIVADAIRFQPGDRVLIPDDEFPSNRYPWMNLTRKDVECTQFSPVRDEPICETLAKLDLTGVRAISISSTSYRTGRCHDIAAFAAFCRERGIVSVVDIIQSLGAMPVDLRAAGVDIACTGAQKWLLGPIGVGVIWARRELLEELDVPQAGWTSVRYPESFELPGMEWADEMTRFEPGLPNILAIEGLHASLRELGSIGWDRIHATIAQNVAKLEGVLAERGIETFAGSEGQAGIVSFEAPSWSEGDRHLADHFHEQGLTVTVRDGYVRVSPQFYSTDEELDAFFRAMRLTGSFSVDVSVSSSTAMLDRGEGVALVTGATGILGGHVARELAERGHDLVLVGRDAAALDELRTKLAAEHADVTVRTEQVDLTDRGQLDGLVARLAADGVHVDVLANLAAVAHAERFAEATAEELDEQLEVGARAPIALTHAVVTQLRAAGRPLRILNVVSSAGRCATPLLSAYAAASGALWTFSEGLGRELATDGVTVTTYVASQMHSRMQKRIGRVALRYFQIGGASFDEFAHPERSAKDAVDAMLAGKPLEIARANKRKVCFNALAPGSVDKRVRAAWRA